MTKSKNCLLCEKRLSKPKYLNCFICKLSAQTKCLGVAENAEYEYICKDCLGNELPFYHLKEKELSLALFELAHDSSAHWDIETLSSLKFNPFNSCDDYGTFNASFNNNFCDPDDKVFTGVEKMIDKCKYYVEDYFVSLTKSSHVEFSLLHLNIRSLRKNFDSFRIYLNLLVHLFHRCSSFVLNMVKRE